MNSPLRIAHFTECWLPQTMTWLYNHLSHLPSDCENQIVCRWTQNLDQFPVNNIASLEEPPEPPTLWRKVRRRLGLSAEARTLALLEKTLRRKKPHVLHSHFGSSGWAGSGVARKCGLPHVVSFYGFDLSLLPKSDPRWVSRYRQMSARVDLVLCEGPHMAQCISRLGVDAGKIRVFRLGIDLARFPFRPRRNRNSGPARFLIAGSFREKKGIPYALEALGIYSRSHPGIEVTVIGDSGGSEREEAEKRKIIEVIGEYGLTSKVRFLGYQPYDVLSREMYLHDVFVSPSVTASDGDTEGGAPVTIIEAAASGMPVLSTLHCDIPFVLADENKPYLARERDSFGLAQALERLMECQDWDMIVRSNRTLVEKELDVRRQAEILASTYRELSGCPASLAEARSSPMERDDDSGVMQLSSPLGSRSK